MVPRFAAPIALLLLVLSGCAGPSAPPAVGPAESPAPETPTPELRGQSRVLGDPSVPSLGGEHDHDYWGDATERTIHEGDLPSYYADYCGTLVNCGSYQYTLEPAPETAPPNSIWPRTGKVTIDVRIDGELTGSYQVGVSSWYRNDGSQELVSLDSKNGHAEFGNVTERQTDPPHTRTSSWRFYFYASGEDLSPTLIKGRVHWTIKIHLSDRPVVVDPPHPDRWGNATMIPILDKAIEASDLKVMGVGIGYSAEQIQLDTEKTVLPLTAFMRVTVAWDSPIPAGSAPTLYSCDPSRECWDYETEFQRATPTEDAAGRRVYDLPLRAEQWDSPYAEYSGWLLRLRFDDVAPPADVEAFQGELRIQASIFKAA